MLRALLIGINNYDPAGRVRPLKGCLRDAKAMRDFLLEFYADQIADIHHIRELFDAQATRKNVIDVFRRHLALAGPEDTVLVYYSGHGARSAAAPEFQAGTTDKLEEGWVLHDSRNPGNFDLADKELALLLEEVGRNNPQIVVIADSCFSNSVTRSAHQQEDSGILHVPAGAAFTARYTKGQEKPRPLDTYLDGAYVRRRAEMTSLNIPFTRHILLSACDKTEEALEIGEQGGLFTQALLDTLRPNGGQIRYGELYTRTAAAIRTLTRRQTPQADVFGGFNPNGGFLGKAAPSSKNRRYAVKFDVRNKAWRIELGAADGLVSDVNTTIPVNLYESPAGGAAVQTTEISGIGATESAFARDPEGLNPTKTYWGEPNRLPLPPFILYGAPTPALDGIRAAIDAQPESAVVLTHNPANCGIGLRHEAGNLMLYNLDRNSLIHGVRGDDAPAVDYMLTVLNHLAHWHRLAALQNRQTGLHVPGVKLRLSILEGETWCDVKNEFVELKFTGARINFRITADNHSGEPLYLLLAYLDPEYGASVLYSNTQPIPQGTSDLLLVENSFYLPQGVEEEEDIIKLIVSNEQIEPGVFSKPALPKQLVDPGMKGGLRSIGGLSKPDWFAKTLWVRIVRK